jgi:hypothetical protein
MTGAVRGYALFRAEPLPVDGTASAAIQYTLDPSENLDLAESTLAIADSSLIPPRITGYEIHHEVLVNQWIKAQGKPYNRFLVPHEFEAFHLPERQLLAFRYKREVVDDFIKHWRLHRRDIVHSLRELEADFSMLDPHVEVITGAWFRFKANPQLRSSGLFGQGVNRSQEYQAAMKTGERSAMQFQFDHETFSTKIMVTARAGIILLQPFAELALELEVVEAAYAMLDQCGAVKIREQRPRRSRTQTEVGDAAPASVSENRDLPFEEQSTTA